MGMNVGMGGGLGQRPERPMSEINVTPLVDIMLVLLIIFMVTAPLLTQGVEVNLPGTSSDPLPSQAEPLVISVTANGAPAIETQPVTMDEMVTKVRAIRDQNPNIQIFVRGDRNAAYGSVMEVMGRLHAAGIRRVSLITQPPKS
ncbi:protein TolR [Magnetofaba australis]|uniref:Tol-Pal system protein TolR n=1 Tax=Magnetofaba australis IT-1 TaxID=1434232 RepID=A0A1Y2K134_9PROT|nr:protein TolR [Magnetofaba australis]OSM01753.1 putative biopolymer transporter ExbD/TolR [Magnetofaba australis IT-1]